MTKTKGTIDVGAMTADGLKVITSALRDHANRHPHGTAQYLAVRFERLLKELQDEQRD